MMNVNRILQNQTPPVPHCLHCGLMVPQGIEDVYCCHGCRSAHQLIQSLQLEEFYRILPGDSKRSAQTELTRSDYTIFDSPSFQAGFIDDIDEGKNEAHFYLSGMTCYACVWVCEQVTRKMDARASLSINMTTGEALLSFPKNGLTLSQYMKSFESLGYAVTPNRRSGKGEQGHYMRLGVAFFCLMNVMMLAIPEYLGVESLDARFRMVFRLISSVLAGVTVFYCAWPFLRNAWTCLRSRTLHLDLPIGLALVVGYVFSTVNMYRGATHVYFDSMTAVVALLLTGRFFQTRALERIMREQARFLEADIQLVRLLSAEDQKLIPLTSINKDDRFRVLPGEVIPLRSQLDSAHGDINYGLLKGEAQPRAIRRGEEILAGAVNGPMGLDLIALENGAESFLLRLQNASRTLYQNKGHYLSLSEKMAKFFVVFTLTAAFGIGLWFLPTDAEEGFRRFAAVLLVACPCIFGFGAPMVIARAFQIGISRGVIFRNQKALEGLSLVEKFYFDKTGTLTDEEAGINRLRWNEANLTMLHVSKHDVLTMLASLSLGSQHHVPRAVSKWAKGLVPKLAASVAGIKDLQEVFGSGLTFTWESIPMRIGRPGFCLGQNLQEDETQGWTLLCMGNAEILRFTLEEELKPEAFSCVQQLVREGKEVHILSGDSTSRVEGVGQTLKLPATRILGNLSPEQKLHAIHGSSSAMIGNGINDTLASSGSSIGIALAHASDTMKAASDIVLVKDGLSPVLFALKLSVEARRVMKRCFALALMFNVVAMSLALSGVVTPAMAAVLMPLSSITVFFSSQKFRLEGAS